MNLFKLLTFLFLSIPTSTGRCQSQFSQSRVDISADGRLFAIPDPESEWNVFACELSSPELQAFLSLSEQELSALGDQQALIKKEQREIVEAARATGANVTDALLRYRNGIDDVLSELLPPDSMALARKLIYRLEVSRIGLADALTSGRLSDAVGIYEDQKAEVSRKATEVAYSQTA